MNALLNTGFAELSNPDLQSKAETIHLKLTTPPASVTYAAVEPSPLDLRSDIDAFEPLIGSGNDPDEAAARNAAREQLIGTLERMAASLEGITPGNRTQLLTTGYDVRKIRERDTTQTGTPQNVAAKTTGNQGEARLSCDPVHQATAYEARAAQDILSGPFTSCPPASSTRGLLFTGLERGKDWFFQIRAIGPNGTGPWSDPAMMMVV